MHEARPLLLLSVLALFAALPSAGCSRFERDWRTPAIQKLSSGDDRMLGRWKGSWKSAASGHSGKLRCVVTPVDEHTRRAEFKASFALVLKFEYTLDLQSEQRQDAEYFHGTADLGKLAGGVYQYDGHADGRTFYCTYRTKSDHGYFSMTRPE
jgi:hypothetical protein